LNVSFNNSKSVILPFINSIFLLSIRSCIFSTKPVERLSTIIVTFSAAKLLAKFDPINPAPPVITIFLFFMLKPTLLFFKEKL